MKKKDIKKRNRYLIRTYKVLSIDEIDSILSATGIDSEIYSIGSDGQRNNTYSYHNDEKLGKMSIGMDVCDEGGNSIYEEKQKKD